MKGVSRFQLFIASTENVEAVLVLLIVEWVMVGSNLLRPVLDVIDVYLMLADFDGRSAFLAVLWAFFGKLPSSIAAYQSIVFARYCRQVLK